MTAQTPAHWYPDPFRRCQHRYWDGIQWTHHVSTQGSQGSDPPVNASPAPSVNTSLSPHVTRASKKIRRQVQAFAGVPQVTDAALFNQPVLVVNQRARLFGVTAEYAVYDEQGQRLGAVRETGHVLMRKALGG